MEREDYEPLAPRANARRDGLTPLTYRQAFLSKISASAMRPGAPAPDHIVIEVVVTGSEEAFGVQYQNAKALDELIKMLIAARNTVWPTP